MNAQLTRTERLKQAQACIRTALQCIDLMLKTNPESVITDADTCLINKTREELRVARSEVRTRR